MKDIKKFLEGRIGEYSFYFQDLTSGYTYALNENVEMVAAGCMKLPIGMALLKQVEQGEVDINRTVKIKEEDMVYGTGILHEFGEKEYNLKELLVAMLLQSDNTAANKIIDIVGIDKINEVLRSMTLNNTVLNRKTIDERNTKGEIQNYSTSADLSSCWKMLYKKTFLNEENSNTIINILKRQTIKNKIGYYYPDRLKREIANKTGDIESVENDTSLISLGKGNFILTVMSANLPSNVYGEVTLSRVGKMALDIIETGWI
ncbi:MAG: serine hydrolase [Bacillota bacterium]|nr:serine hydrolase [Bacillota bacterium]